MTPEEIQKRLQAGEGVHPEEVTYEDLDEANCLSVMMPIPDDPHERAMLFANNLVQICMGFRGKNEELLVEVRTLAAAVSYLLNSSSFIDGEYYEWDKREINRKLRRDR